jgi:hypothetical protein
MGFDLGDLTAIEPSTGGGSYEVLPKGQYRLSVNEVSEETLTDKGGSYIYVEYAVAEGELEGSSFRCYYNIKNDSQKTVEIAWRDLAALGRSTGVPGGDADLLLGKTFMAMVGIKPPSVGKNGKQYGESNNILKYYRPDEQVTPPSPAPAAARPAPAAVARPAAVAATGARPWAKRA